MDSTFILLTVILIVGMVIIMVAPIFLIVWAICHFRKKAHKEDMEMYQMIQKRQEAKERLQQEEIDLKKMKYRRIKCPYCDTSNQADQAYCIGCGAGLTVDKKG